MTLAVDLSNDKSVKILKYVVDGTIGRTKDLLAN
jgi:hypothetical protein